MDVSIEGFLKKKDPVLSDYYQFRKDFDNDELIVVGIEGEQVFEMKFLNTTLILGFLSSFGGLRFENGGFLRIKAEYAYTDRLKFESGLPQSFPTVQNGISALDCLKHLKP